MREREKTIRRVRNKAADLASELSGRDLADSRVYLNWEVCALLDEIDDLRGLLGLFTPKEINGYDFEKLMVDAKEYLKKVGGWQNCYAISAVLAGRAAVIQHLAGTEEASSDGS